MDFPPSRLTFVCLWLRVENRSIIPFETTQKKPHENVFLSPHLAPWKLRITPLLLKPGASGIRSSRHPNHLFHPKPRESTSFSEPHVDMRNNPARFFPNRSRLPVFQNFHTGFSKTGTYLKAPPLANSVQLSTFPRQTTATAGEISI